MDGRKIRNCEIGHDLSDDYIIFSIDMFENNDEITYISPKASAKEINHLLGNDPDDSSYY